MATFEIDYSKIPAFCRSDDQDCVIEMATKIFFRALDEQTSVAIGDPADGTIDAGQIRFILKDGKLTDEAIRGTIEKHNSSHPEMTITAAPYAKDVVEYLAKKHPNVYDNLFVKTPVRSQADVKKAVRANVLKFARLLDQVASGQPQTVDQREYVVTVYANGFGIPSELNPIMVRHLGGQDNADYALSLLEDAFAKMPPQRDTGEACNQLLENGGVDVSQCYRNTAKRLRQLADRI